MITYPNSTVTKISKYWQEKKKSKTFKGKGEILNQVIWNNQFITRLPYGIWVEFLCFIIFTVSSNLVPRGCDPFGRFFPRMTKGTPGHKVAGQENGKVAE